MTICFPFPRPLCDLPRPHLQMLLYIQRTKPSSSILPMIRMPRMLPVVSSTIQQLVELPTECTMAQSIAGPGKYCTRKVKCHPRSVSCPSRKSSATIRAPARLPSQPRLIQFWDRWSVSGSGSASPIDRPDRPSPSYFSSSKRKRHFSRIVTLLSLREESRSSLDDCEQRLTNTYASSEAA